MKLSVNIEYVNPPIPCRDMDYAAMWDCDEGEEDAIVGRGATAQEAVKELMILTCETDPLPGHPGHPGPAMVIELATRAVMVHHQYKAFGI